MKFIIYKSYELTKGELAQSSPLGFALKYRDLGVEPLKTQD